ncbi:hypothetical protein HII31_07878 [Pseudocercospora fuligena]|uniref:F-box domain-containing protein n=1 Tax=Pseudocercospora fuligena TaxID=685502 RepID=A0A8H6RFR5_9PEZI|nr:hypothetical protein HII31_07878 [Pseudocercospora fuligena]
MMAVSQSTYDYGDLDIPQLQAIAAAKSVIPTTKWQLISYLKKLDDTPYYFRFLDLPPELRNRVYELVVAGSRVKVSMNPWAKTITSLLRTCKQVHDEARGELYHNSCMTLFLYRRLLGFSTPSYPKIASEGAWLATHQLDALGSRYEGVDGEGDIEDKRKWEISVRRSMDFSTEAPTPSIMHSLWSPTMAELSIIEIGVCAYGPPEHGYRDDDQDRDGKPNYVNQFLYSLVAVLNEGVKPQLLRLTFAAHYLDLSEDYLTEMLYPLAKLRKGIRVDLHCYTDDAGDEDDDDDENAQYTRRLERRLGTVWKSRDTILRYNALEASSFGIRELEKYLQAHEGHNNVVIKHAQVAKQRLEDFYLGWDRLIKRDDERYICKVMRYVMAIMASQDALEGAEDQWEEEWSERFKEIDNDDLMEV